MFGLIPGILLIFCGDRNHKHRHSYYEVCLVLDGRGQFEHGDIRFPLVKGDLFIADPGIIHEIISNTESSLKIQFISFSFSESEEDTEVRQGDLYEECVSAFIKKHPRIINGCDLLARYFRELKTVSAENNKLKWYLYSEAIIRMIILDILFRSTEDLLSANIDLDLEQRLGMAIRYIKDNSFRKLSVEEVAAQACTSPRTLRRLMKDQYNLTVIEKCSEIRIEASAGYLLMHPESNVNEVGYRFGFQNPSDYCRLFKKFMKISPSVFRKSKGTVFTSKMF